MSMANQRIIAQCVSVTVNTFYERQYCALWRSDSVRRQSFEYRSAVQVRLCIRFQCDCAVFIESIPESQLWFIDEWGQERSTFCDYVWSHRILIFELWNRVLVGRSGQCSVCAHASVTSSPAFAYPTLTTEDVYDCLCFTAHFFCVFDNECFCIYLL